MIANWLTAAQVAEALEVSTETINRWLDGRTLPRVNNLLAIDACYPDWPLRYLLTGEGETKVGAASVPVAYPRYQDTRTLIGAYYGYKSEADRLKVPYYPAFAQDIKHYLREVMGENERLLEQVTQHLKPKGSEGIGHFAHKGGILRPASLLEGL